MSINANDTNCAPGDSADHGLRDQGAQLFREHANFWAQLAAGTAPAVPGNPFGSGMTGRVDMSRVGLFGHSRGGERAIRVVQTNTNPNISYIAQYLVAPSDIAATNGSPTVPTSIPTAFLYGSRDGDTAKGGALKLYDRATVPMRSLQYVYGANHAAWNTRWGLTDPLNFSSASPATFPNLTGPDQAGTLQAMARSWFEWHLLGRNPVANRALASGDAMILTPQGTPILTSFSTAQDVMFDDFENTNPLGNFFSRPVTPTVDELSEPRLSEALRAE